MWSVVVLVNKVHMPLSLDSGALGAMLQKFVIMHDFADFSVLHS